VERIKSRTLWDLALLVLGLNIWVSFLVLPFLHLPPPDSNRFIRLLIGLPLIVLICGVIIRNALLLLGAFPIFLLVPVLFCPQLVGVNVFSSWTFLVICLSLLAYILGTPLILQALATAGRTAQEEAKFIPGFQASTRWRRRFRVYRGMSILAGLFPALFIFTIFLQPDIQADLRVAYPNRSNEATTLFGILALALWLGLFYTDFLVPLKAHVRGDPHLRSELARFRKISLGRQPRKSFFIFVGLALALMLVLFMTRG
jgi:hypothetical protein